MGRSQAGLAASRPFVFDLGLTPLELEAGPRLARPALRGWWWGPAEAEASTHAALAEVTHAPWQLTPAAADAPRARGRLDPRFPIILVVHALTGDMVVGGGGGGGWWAPLVAPGASLDPARAHVLCFNNLGGCYGSTGPLDADFPDRDAPKLSTWDQARALLAALDALGVGEVALAVGGSLGGMITLALATLAPGRFARVVPLAASAAASPWVVGLNHVQRALVARDLEARGPADEGAEPTGLELARRLAMLSYRAEPGLELTQGRRLAPDGRFAIETYLEHQGRKLARRFDPRAYLAQLAAMDAHDVERAPRGFVGSWRGLERVEATVVAAGVDTDLLFFPSHAAALAARIPGAVARTITSPHGHDAFLIELDQVDAILREALARAPFAARARGARRAAPRLHEEVR
jgi:homoserine O-acetyltransferase